jgi:hypothetical protein
MQVGRTLQRQIEPERSSVGKQAVQDLFMAHSQRCCHDLAGSITLTRQRSTDGYGMAAVIHHPDHAGRMLLWLGAEQHGEGIKDAIAGRIGIAMPHDQPEQTRIVGNDATPA